MRFLALNVAATAMLFLGTAAYAIPITYDLNRTIGTDGMVSGFITTDGTIGTLAEANITDWELTLSFNAGASATISSAGGLLNFDGLMLSATSDSLIWDPTTTPGFLAFSELVMGSIWSYTLNNTFAAGPGELIFCAASLNPCPSDYSISGSPILFGTNDPFVIATVAPMGAAEPATVALLGLGLAGLGLARRRK